MPSKTNPSRRKRARAKAVEREKKWLKKANTLTAKGVAPSRAKGMVGFAAGGLRRGQEARKLRNGYYDRKLERRAIRAEQRAAERRRRWTIWGVRIGIALAGIGVALLFIWLVL